MAPAWLFTTKANFGVVLVDSVQPASARSSASVKKSLLEQVIFIFGCAAGKYNYTFCVGLFS